MLAYKHRLHKTKEIEAIHEKGRKIYTPFFLLKYKPNELGFLRAAILASTKISKNATVRNKIRRVLFEIIRTRTDYKNTGLDILIIVSPKCYQDKKVVKHSVLLAELLSAWGKMPIKNASSKSNR